MPLTYVDRGEAKSGTRLSVMAGPVRVASITKTMQSIMAKDGERWDWHMHHPYGPPGYETRGQTGSLAQAKADVERMWTVWLQAVLEERG